MGIKMDQAMGIKMEYETYMNFMFRFGSHPQENVCANILKSEKIPKSETLLVPNILDKGY
jgi:hypothetical protein